MDRASNPSPSHQVLCHGSGINVFLGTKNYLNYLKIKLLLHEKQFCINYSVIIYNLVYVKHKLFAKMIPLTVRNIFETILNLYFLPENLYFR